MAIHSLHKKTGSAKKTERSGLENHDGYFNQQSIIRRVYREGAVLLSGGRSVLLQLAHPFVCAGVADHSNFQSEILNRLYRTLLFIQNLIFEDRQQTQKALQQFHAMHERIRGYLSEQAGRFPKGTPYSGRDPQAKLWVHATFVDTVLKVYERFVKPLSTEEKQMYYSDTLLLAQLMEIPDDIVPKTKKDFDIYMKNMISSDTLAVTPAAKSLAREVIYPRVSFLPRISAFLLRFVTAGILPARIREAYGLKWSRLRQAVLDALSYLIRFLRPFAPAWIWQNPLLKGKLTYFLLWGRKSAKMKRSNRK